MPGLRHPRPLRPNDRIRVISPAGPVRPEHLEAGLEVLSSWGMRVEVDARATASRPRPRGYLAGSDAERLAALHAAFADASVGAILCSRGGYGAMRLLPKLDLDLVARHPKLFVGFSDITALHLALVAGANMATLHGPVIKSLGSLHEPGDSSQQALRDALLGERRGGFVIDSLRCVQPGRGRGPALGGNLSVLCAMLPTAHCPDLGGAVLVVEDIGEPDYRLDRLLTTLRLACHRRPPAALVLGEFTDCHGVYADGRDLDAMLDAIAHDFPCPVVAGFPSGHGPRNVAWPMGVEAEVDAEAGVVRFLEDTAR